MVKPVLQPGDFEVPASNILILPFSVRLQKVAAVVGVPVSDPLMNSLRDNRASLGDYDFANNLQPDKTWTALKVADWVRAIKPICASPQMLFINPPPPASPATRRPHRCATPDAFPARRDPRPTPRPVLDRATTGRFTGPHPAIHQPTTARFADHLRALRRPHSRRSPEREKQQHPRRYRLPRSASLLARS